MSDTISTTEYFLDMKLNALSMPRATTRGSMGKIANILLECGASFVMLDAMGAIKNQSKTSQPSFVFLKQQISKTKK